VTTPIDRDRAERWRAEILPLLNGLSQPAAVERFVLSACRLAALDKKAVARILAYDVALLLDRWHRDLPAQRTDEQLWDELVDAVSAGVERIVSDDGHIALLPLTEAPADTAPSVESAYEREQTEEALPARLAHSEEAALRKIAPAAPEMLAEMKRRMLRAKKPIYLLLWAEPHRWRALVGLFVALWPDVALFESLASTYQGCPGLPSAKDYAEAEKLRIMLRMRATGHSAPKTAAILHATPYKVRKALKDWDTGRISDSAAERRLLSAFNQAIHALWGAVLRSGLSPQ
jgi:hypothetical protein